MEKVKKTLIFCFDGTCNDPEDVENYVDDGSITNIRKLHVLFEADLCEESKNRVDDGTSLTKDGSHQKSFYYPGIGTYGCWIMRLYNKTLAPEHADVKRILNDAIEDLNKHYRKEENDHVLIFGFSRGAALARRFASVAREEPGMEDLKIDFLGVFDTVTAISSLSRIGTDLSVKTKPANDIVFANGTMMSQDVKKAVHLVALDENRIAFQPTLFDYDPVRITEVWFPGTHSDVGGGYWYDGLSDVALKYMIEKVKQECGEYVWIPNPDDVDYDRLNDGDGRKITKDDINRKPLVDGILHEHKRKITNITTIITAVITAGITAGIAAGVTAGITAGVIVGLIVGLIVRKMISKITLNPREVRIAKDPAGKHPMVHESVQLRYKKVAGYRPHALRDAEYFLTTDDCQAGEGRQGVSGLGMEKKQRSST